MEKDLLDNFFNKTDELISQLEQNVFMFEADPDEREIIDNVFRLFHTIKGNSAIFGFHELKKAAHSCEDIMGAVRERRGGDTEKIVQFINRGVELVRKEYDRLSSSGGVGESDLKQVIDEYCGAVNVFIASDIGNDKAVSDTKVYLCGEKDVSSAVEKIESFLSQGEPAMRTSFISGLEDISAVFGGIGKDDAKAHVLKMKTDFELMAAEDDDIPDLVLNMMRESFLSVKEHLSCVERRSLSSKSDQNVKFTIDSRKPTFRVEEEKVEAVLNVLGKMKGVYEIFETLKIKVDSSLTNAVERGLTQLKFIDEELQSMMNSLQKAKPKVLLGTLTNLVKALSRPAKKQIRIETLGEDVPIARSKIEVLEKVLIHIIRNSIDHGIEPPEERQTLGKPPEGTVKVEFYEGDYQIIIAVSDDGRGIDCDALREKAVEVGTISEIQKNDFQGDRAIELLFAPGVSTSKRVSDISGRGVGMDVVKDCISKIGGTITVDTKKGIGTMFLIKL